MISSARSGGQRSQSQGGGTGGFSDGCEPGSPGAWTPSGGLHVEGGRVHSGRYAVEAKTTTGWTYATKTLPATYTDATATIWFDLVSASSQVNVRRLRTAADGSIAYLGIDTSGRLLLRSDAGSRTITSTTTVSKGVWHSLSLHALIGTTGRTEVWLDGTLVAALSTSVNLGSTAIGRLQIGEVNSGRTYDVVFDDVSLAIP